MIRKNINWILALILLPILAACSWEDLPAYEDADITGVQFRYRWMSDVDKDPITNEPIVKEIQLQTSSSIDAENGTITCVVTVPAANGAFTEAVRNGVTTNPLWGQVTLTTAARIAPSDGNKALGTPDDWSKPHAFVVSAANGNKKAWTITVTELKK